MKLSTLSLQLAASLGASPLAWAQAERRDGAGGCCKFTITSGGAFVCPAGQLEDGQIRLNGTYATSTFCIGADGGFTDQNGFGCIVTDPPTTQIQCDHGKPPTKGFSIGPDNALLYKGSPNFFACPATDTEWNIYVSPDFGQTKCTPITLKSDGCGAPSEPAPSSSPAPSCPPLLPSTVTATSTVWQTDTMTSITTEVFYETLTETETETMPCTTNSTTSRCSKCTRTPTATFPGSLSSSSSVGGGCTKSACTGGDFNGTITASITTTTTATTGSPSSGGGGFNSTITASNTTTGSPSGGSSISPSGMPGDRTSGGAIWPPITRDVGEGMRRRWWRW